MSIVEDNPSVDWVTIEEVWCTGVGSLGAIANDNEIPLAAILLAAKEEEWDDRKSPWADVKPKDPEKPSEIHKKHKQSLAVIRELAEVLMKQLQFGDGVAERTKTLEKISTIMARIVTLERVVHGLNTESDGAPDSVEIHI